MAWGDTVLLGPETDGGIVERGEVAVTYLTRLVHQDRDDIPGVTAALGTLLTRVMSSAGHRHDVLESGVESDRDLSARGAAAVEHNGLIGNHEHAGAVSGPRRFGVEPDRPTSPAHWCPS